MRGGVDRSMQAFCLMVLRRNSLCAYVHARVCLSPGVELHQRDERDGGCVAIRIRRSDKEVCVATGKVGASLRAYLVSRGKARRLCGRGSVEPQ